MVIRYYNCYTGLVLCHRKIFILKNLNIFHIFLLHKCLLYAEERFKKFMAFKIIRTITQHHKELMTTRATAPQRKE